MGKRLTPKQQTFCRRLLRLADLLQYEIEDQKFDFKRWGYVKKECGFVGCALGWATTIPEFKNLGLKFNINDDIIGKYLNNKYRHENVNEVIERIFGVNYEESNVLFRPDYGFPKLGLDAEAARLEVVANIRRYCLIKYGRTHEI